MRPNYIQPAKLYNVWMNKYVIIISVLIGLVEKSEPCPYIPGDKKIYSKQTVNEEYRYI
jgi:hypothetical protein